MLCKDYFGNTFPYSLVSTSKVKYEPKLSERSRHCLHVLMAGIGR